MNETYNWKSLFVGIVITIIGIIMCIISAFIRKSAELWSTVLISVGCSLIASGIVILMHDFFFEKKKINPLDEWGIDKIYSSRTERNRENDPNIDKAKYRVDGIAFGLSSFRQVYEKKVEEC